MSKAERAAAKSLLENYTDGELAALMMEQVPWVFQPLGGDSFSAWRAAIVEGTDIAAESVFLVGSASVGISLAEEKAGRAFRRTDDEHGASDIDIAVVSPDLFTSIWETFVRYERTRALSVAYKRRPQLKAGVYWGFVNSPQVPGDTDEARLLRSVLTTSGRIDPLRGHKSSVRVYRRDEDLFHYQVSSIGTLRRSLR